MIPVSFACNNPQNGLSLGNACAIPMHGEGGDIELECPAFPGPNMVCREDVLRLPRTKLLFPMPDRCDCSVKLGHEWFGCHGWKGWYGNWCWDAARMPGVEALRMLMMLRELKWRRVAVEVKFGEANDAGLPLTRNHLHYEPSVEPRSAVNSV